MSVTPITRATPPKPDVSDHDRIMSALNKAIEYQQRDEALGQSAQGIAIVWYHESPGDKFSEQFIVQGLNALETIGLLKITADDISKYGLEGAPLAYPEDHDPKDPA